MAVVRAPLGAVAVAALVVAIFMPAAAAAQAPAPAPTSDGLDSFKLPHTLLNSVYCIAVSLSSSHFKT
ncbi:AGP16 isoform 1 precursor [Zea mays]|uniref:AGP16 n=1 Tax=Zea mays TaxID=4577 RepID=B6SKH3_MAIZE|nr:AGP16 precursor 1 precursor [Zea mays]ACG25356.1 AGP16 [Zea mays]|eukprot:NP_001158939.1 AGP16 precursor [Zea mays]